MPNKKWPFFTQDDYEILKREVLYDGYYRLSRYQFRHERFDGGWSEAVVRELMERTASAALLPYDPVLDYVVLIEQFRVGALANPTSPWLIEIVAGLLEPDEKPADVVIRETKEEANLEVLDLYAICEYFVSPGGTNEYLSLFCGRVDASQAGGVHGLKDEHEDIRVIPLPLEEALIWVQEGKIKTSPAILALQWLQLNREWLRQLWQQK